ncbi:MAG: hypothetical protein CO021_08830 [Deltaproteobacteria bacterium CG_4_9_14_0_2_um_filter_42_21]|nr:MAG: hypothetical protein CO021_08830 [Deltaproteobacteria bacterium CG_4_9_14_0_2_um_filter_42_21]
MIFSPITLAPQGLSALAAGTAVFAGNAALTPLPAARASEKVSSSSPFVSPFSAGPRPEEAALVSLVIFAARTPTGTSLTFYVSDAATAAKPRAAEAGTPRLGRRHHRHHRHAHAHLHLHLPQTPRAPGKTSPRLEVPAQPDKPAHGEAHAKRDKPARESILKTTAPRVSLAQLILARLQTLQTSGPVPAAFDNSLLAQLAVRSAPAKTTPRIEVAAQTTLPPKNGNLATPLLPKISLQSPLKAAPLQERIEAGLQAPRISTVARKTPLRHTPADLRGNDIRLASTELRFETRVPSLFELYLPQATPTKVSTAAKANSNPLTALPQAAAHEAAKQNTRETAAAAVFAPALLQTLRERPDLPLAGATRELRPVDATRHDTMPVLFGLSTSGGETALQQAVAESKSRLKQRIRASLQEALELGPQALAEGEALQTLNDMLRMELWQNQELALREGEMNALILESLLVAVNSIPAFHAEGPRSRAEVEADLLGLLQVTSETLADWETFFGISFIGTRQRKSDSPHLNALFAGDVREMLVNAVREGLSENIAAQGLMSSEGINVEGEMVLQWELVRILNASSVFEQVDKAATLLTYFGKEEGLKTAGLALALMVQNSALMQTANTDESAIAPTLSQEVLRQIMLKVLTTSLWPLASHRSFRAHFTPEQNELINALVAETTGTTALDSFRNVDPADEAAFWDALGKTGVEEQVMQRVVAAMMDTAGSAEFAKALKNLQ